MSVVERLGRNLQFSAYSRAIVILSSLVLTPFILNHVDLGLYGLNALILSVVGYFKILDLGLSTGIARFTATFFGEGKQEKISDVLCFGIKFFVSLGCLVALILFLLSFFYEHLFPIQGKLVEKGRILLIIYAFSALFMWSILPFRGVLNGFQRTDIIDKVGLIIAILNIPITLAVLTYTGSYLLFIGILQFVTVAVSLTIIALAFKYTPDFRFSLAPISISLRKQIIRFSTWSFASGLAGLIIFEVDHLIIGSFLGLNAVAIYVIALNVHNLIRMLNGLIGNPVYYAVTAEFSKRDKKERDALIIDATIMHSGILIPILIITLISTDNFILSWVGERFSGSILPCKILLSYWFFNIITEVLAQGVIGGKGKAIEPAKINGFVAVTNLGLSLLLVKFMGITGVALGTAIPFILASSFYIYRYCRILSIPVLKFLHQAVIPNLPLFLTSLILALLGQKYMSNSNVFQVVAIMGVTYGITLIIGYTFLSNRNKQLAQKIIVLRA